MKTHIYGHEKFTILLFTVLLPGALTSCEKRKEVRWHVDTFDVRVLTYSTYVNESSNVITMKVTSMINSGKTRQENMTVFLSKPLDIKYEDLRDFQRPFSLFPYAYHTIDRVEVSNGKAMVKQRSQNFSDTPDELFDLSKYVKTKEEPYKS